MVFVDHFDTTELARMQSTQDSAMQDTCALLEYSADLDPYGNPSAVYNRNEIGACGLELINPQEWQTTGEVPIIHARLRLPIDTELDPRDRIQVTHRYNAALDTPLEFELVGPPKRGPSGLYMDLRIVDDGTEDGA